MFIHTYITFVFEYVVIDIFSLVKTVFKFLKVLEKLHRARWGPEDGVGCIIISPTKELAGQLFEEFKFVGKYHSLSAGLLIGGRKDVEAEKERVNFLNILVCTPGRLLQHMNETPNFECSELQVNIYLGFLGELKIGLLELITNINFDFLLCIPGQETDFSA